MDHYQKLITTITNLQSPKWVDQYFELVVRLLLEFHIRADDIRTALTVPDSNKGLHVGFGQSYVLTALRDGYISLIAPLYFQPGTDDSIDMGYFYKKGEPDARLIGFHWVEGQPLPERLYRACSEESLQALSRCKRSGFRKYHSPLLYDAVMNPQTRDEILKAAQSSNVYGLE